LTVIYARAALNDLDEIWEWNCTHRGAEHANDYVNSLRKRMEDLSSDPNLGKVVEADPTYRYLVMRKRPNVDGHVAGYRIDQRTLTIRVLRILHTKQDWRAKLEAGE
jgi:plasmid stabilization system protein ParE